MRLSPEGRAFIRNTERLALTAYPDGDGYSIGYGHFGAQKGETITKARAEQLFTADVARFEKLVNDWTPHVRLQQQFDALVSFAYNIGEGGYRQSTAARLQNEGNELGAADALRMWTKSQGVTDPRLVRRREQERSLYLYGDPSAAAPATVEAPGRALVFGLGAAAAAYLLLPRLSLARRTLALSAAAE
jgi:lysozyme